MTFCGLFFSDKSRRIECCHTLHGAKGFQCFDRWIVVNIVNFTFLLVNIHHNNFLKTITLNSHSSNSIQILAYYETTSVDSSRNTTWFSQLNSLAFTWWHIDFPKIILKFSVLHFATISTDLACKNVDCILRFTINCLVTDSSIRHFHHFTFWVEVVLR